MVAKRLKEGANFSNLHKVSFGLGVGLSVSKAVC